MHVVITGANSYIGAALTHFLIEHPHLDGQLITRLTRTDLHPPALKAAPDWVYQIARKTPPFRAEMNSADALASSYPLCVSCCSMSCRTISIGAPPPLAAKTK